jgi:hypothetical protein
VGQGRGRLRALLVGCALAPLLAYAGCLNPRPEEDPSANVEGVPSVDFNPSRESCMDNPALPECAVPVRGGESDTPPEDLDADDAPTDVSEEAPPAAPAPPPDAGGTAADTTSDAGVPVEPADASAP